MINKGSYEIRKVKDIFKESRQLVIDYPILFSVIALYINQSND